MQAALCRQTLATFGPATVEDVTPTLGGHARAKTVGTLALEYAGLKCSFHSYVPDNGSGEPDQFMGQMVPGQKKGGLFYVNAPANSIERAVFLHLGH